MTQEKQIERLQKKRDVKQAYKRLFATEDGRTVLKDWMHMFTTSKAPGSTELLWYVRGQEDFIKQVIHTANDPIDFSKEITSLIQEIEENKKENTYD